MKHIDDIKGLAEMLMSGPIYNSLIVQSPPGWAKSTTINKILDDLGKPWSYVGSYSTPLFLYNALVAHPDKILVLDDCAGLFDNLAAMAILKAATWPSAGTGDRIVSWGSTSEKVSAPIVNFKGKLILLTNVLPEGRDAAAFKSRSLFYNIKFTKGNIANMLGEAACQKKYFPNQKRAKQVAKFLIDKLEERDYTQFNLRTLHQGYLAADVRPTDWKDLFSKILPDVKPRELVKQLSATDDDIEDQARHFQKVTGMTRRYFFLLRQEMGMTGNAPVGRKTEEHRLQRETRRAKKK